MRKIKHWATGLVLWAQAFLLRILTGKGEIMMAMFFAQRVILGKTAYGEVPAALRAQVRELLIDSGLDELAAED